MAVSDQQAQQDKKQQAKAACCFFSDLLGLDSHEQRMRQLDQLYERLVKQRKLELQAKVTIFEEGTKQLAELQSEYGKALGKCQNPEAERAVNDWFRVAVSELRERIKARLEAPVSK